MSDGDRREAGWRWLYRRLGDETHHSVQLRLIEDLGFWLRTGNSVPFALRDSRWTDTGNTVFRRPRQALLFTWLLFVSLLIHPVAFILVGTLLMFIRWLHGGLIRRAVASYRADLENAMPVEQVVECHPHLFEATTRAALTAGARSSRLPDALSTVHATLASRHKLHQRLVSAAAYPIVAGYVCFTTAWVIAWKILPTFAEMYWNLGAELPWAFRLTVAVYESDAMSLFIFLLTFLFFGGSLGTHRSRDWFRDRVLARVPLVGEIVGCTHRAHIDRMLAMSLRGGERLDGALRSIASTIASRTFARRLILGADAVAAGSGLEAGLAPLRLYSGLDSWLLARAGDANKLASTLETLAGGEDRRRRDHERALLLYLEVAAVFAIGIVVAVLALSVLQTHFGLNPLVTGDYGTRSSWSSP